MISGTLQEKCDQLLSVLRECGRVAVAFSGGVDSAVVARGAALACGDRAVAVTADSPSLAEGELEIARQVADQIGIRHVVIRTDEFSIPGYRANSGDRCYYCKSELYSELEALADVLEADVICNGANLDDLGDHRPGMKAAEEHRVRSPLIEAGFTKQDVRDLALAWDLPVWDKPAAPCLSSRIAYGVSVTPDRVRKVDAAERYLKNLLDVRELRVRLEQGELARIELPPASLQQVSRPEFREKIIPVFKELGFQYVTLDLEGFRSGSLNAALPLVSLDILSTASSRAQ